MSVTELSIVSSKAKQTWVCLIILCLEMLSEEGSNVDVGDDVDLVVVKLLVNPQVAPTVSDSDEMVGVDTDTVHRVPATDYGVNQLSLLNIKSIYLFSGKIFIFGEFKGFFDYFKRANY